MTMGSDTDIRRFVEDGFQWGPDVDASDIAVSVKGGAVTLAGFAASFNDKFEAEGAAKRAAGVVGLANDIAVRLPNVDLRQNPAASADGIQVIVKEGWVTVEATGEVVLNGWFLDRT
jgi:hypothetical protein